MVDPPEQMELVQRYAAERSGDDLRQAVAATRARLAELPPYLAEHLIERLTLAELLHELGQLDNDPGR